MACCLLSGLAAALLGAGCARTATKTGVVPSGVGFSMDAVKEIFGSYSEGNFQNRAWPDAFQAMHQKLSREYAFTDWKKIDWDVLYDTHAPLVEAAELAQDDKAYYLALRSYLFSIPDGSLCITTPETYREEAIGGGYGFSVAPMEDGRIRVVQVEPGFFADMAGIKWGAEIIQWNDLPVAKALEQTSLLWNDTPCATRECRLLKQCALLTRAPVGTTVSVMFRNLDSESVWVTRLEARRDSYKTLSDPLQQEISFSEFDSPMVDKVLDGGIGYMKLHGQTATLATPFPARAFRRIVERFLDDDVNGLIVDLRGNVGGLDDLAASYAGHFMQTPMFYRDQVAFDYAKGGFALNKAASITIEPRTPCFTGPVMVLIDYSTRGNSQALADSLHELPNVTLVGASGTDGSWALPGGKITMPQGYVISYPIGRMLDESGSIRITAKADLESPVKPDILLPLTLEACRAFFQDGRDVLLDKALEEIKARNTVTSS
ncbi:MAG: Peptidase family S41 [Candidatus Hydrogenedentes bacterium ADurb.Bin101]|nr:MAG: Peptidase family S41 [Candidatus Hydrogenedentes bacterium ADurb.Bin101]